MGNRRLVLQFPTLPANGARTSRKALQVGACALLHCTAGCSTGDAPTHSEPQAFTLEIIQAPSAVNVDGVPLATQPVLEVRDQQGRRFARSEVLVDVSIASGTGQLQGAARLRSVDGRAAFSDLAIAGTGKFTLHFAAAGLHGATSDTLGVGGHVFVVDTIGLNLLSDSAERASGTYRYRTARTAVPDSGTLLIGPEHGGYLRRVVRTSRDSTYLTLTTTAASVSDALVSGTVSDSTVVTSVGLQQASRRIGPSVKATEAVTGTDLQLIRAGGVLLAAKRVTVDFNPSVTRSLTFERGRLSDLRVSIGGSVMLDVEFAASYTLNARGSGSVRLLQTAPVPLPTLFIPTPVPGVLLPVYSDLVLRLDLTADAGAEATTVLQGGFRGSGWIGGTVHFTQGSGLTVTPDYAQEYSEIPLSMSGDINAFAELGVRATAFVRFYQVGGPTVSVEPRLRVTATANTTTERLTLVCNSAFDLSAGAKLAIFRQDLIDLSVPVATLFPAEFCRRTLPYGSVYPVFTSLASNGFGGYSTCGISTGGAAYCWGNNDRGQIGDGTTTTRLNPVPVSGDLTFKQLALGAEHACGITTAGDAYCWGDNRSGELGDGTFTGRAVPVAVNGGLKFRSLAAGGFSTCGLTTIGTAYCWGSALDGKLGLADTTVDRQPFPAPVIGGIGFSEIAVGSFHTCAIAFDGAAYCWGVNYDGTLGIGDTYPRYIWRYPVPVAGESAFRDIRLGSNNSCALSNDERAYCWGTGEDGALGDGTTAGYRGTPGPVAGGLYFMLIRYTFRDGCGVVAGGVTYCWGLNNWGQLGDSTYVNRSVPVRVAGGLTFATVSTGSIHTCALGATGKAYCWGNNSYGQLGDGTTFTRSFPAPVRNASPH